MPDQRRPATDLLHDFAVHGAPFAFPPTLGAVTLGIPTAHSSPAFRGIVESADMLVWPHADGTARGQSLVPLFPGAPKLTTHNRPLYELLTILDAVRAGSTRVRKIAADLLGERLRALSA